MRFSFVDEMWVPLEVFTSWTLGKHQTTYVVQYTMKTGKTLVNGVPDDVLSAGGINWSCAEEVVDEEIPVSAVDSGLAKSTMKPIYDT